MNYRKDVDGLRSVAVLPVILYHVGISVFSGGYVGVDIFFVISGYLITGLISAEMAEDRFSVANFYVRRIKRIFPALYFMLAVSFIMSLVLLMPKHLAVYGKSLISTVFFGSNIFFWKQSGYFEAAAETKPLLHTWSLGVEEQFYIFFPLFLYFLHNNKKHIKTYIFTVFCVSFALSIVLTPKYPTSAFYLLHTRAWELMMGSLVALGVYPKTDNKFVLNGLSAIGVALICVGVFTFGKETQFPYYNAAIPCLGAAFIIAAGVRGEPLINKILGFRPLVFIGLISYSLYLWHWPLIAMRNYYSVVVHPNFFISDTFIIALTFFFAIFSYYMVERPFRVRKVTDRKSLFRRSAYVMAGFTVLGSVVYFTHGLPARMPDTVNRITEVQNSAYRNERCFYYDPLKTTEDRLCRMGDEKRKPKFIVWGDSHALSLSDGFDKYAREHNVTGVFAGKSTCPPIRLVKLYEKGSATNCRQFNEIVFDIIRKDDNIKDVFLAARWEMYVSNDTVARNLPRITLEDGVKKNTDGGNAKIFKDGLMRTVKGLVKSGKNVYFVMDVPEVSFDPSSELGKQEYLKNLFGGSDRVSAYVSLDNYENRNKQVLDAYEAVKQTTAVEKLDLYKAVCRDDKCFLSYDGKSLYFDDNHLSRFGSNYVVGEYSKELDKILRP